MNKVTKADRESVRLAKSELQTIHIKDFACDISKTVEKVREIVAVLQANSVIAPDHLTTIINVFKDSQVLFFEFIFD